MIETGIGKVRPAKPEKSSGKIRQRHPGFGACREVDALLDCMAAGAAWQALNGIAAHLGQEEAEYLW
jgi:hypothetical protein